MNFWRMIQQIYFFNIMQRKNRSYSSFYLVSDASVGPAHLNFPYRELIEMNAKFWDTILICFLEQLFLLT